MLYKHRRYSKIMFGRQLAYISAGSSFCLSGLFQDFFLIFPSKCFDWTMTASYKTTSNSQIVLSPSAINNLIFSERRTINTKNNEDKLNSGVHRSVPCIIPRLKQPLNFKLIQG